MSGCVYDGWQPESYLSIWPDPDLIIWLDCEPEEEEAKAEHVTVAVLQELRKSYQALFDQLNKEHHIKIKKINTDNLSSEELLTIVNEEVEKIIPAPKNPEPILTAYQV
jgi:deoxyadenosine/deoxycytidine kinase